MAMNSLSVLGGNFATTAYVNSVVGLRLITPTSMANSGGSAALSGGAVTFTGVSSVSLNNVFTSAYQNYRIIVQGVSSVNQLLRLRLRVSGTDNTTADHNTQSLAANGTTVSGGRDTAQTSFVIGEFRTTTAQSTYAVDLYNSQSSTLQKIFTVQGTDAVNAGIVRIYGGVKTNTTSFDGLTIFLDADNMTGTMRVYGYNNG